MEWNLEYSMWNGPLIIIIPTNYNGVFSLLTFVHAPLFALKSQNTIHHTKTNDIAPTMAAADGALSMEIRPQYYTHREEIVHSSYGYSDVFLIRLVLRRRPIYAISRIQRHRSNHGRRRRPLSTEHFPPSYGPDTDPIERNSSLLYTTIIQILFLPLVLHRHLSYATHPGYWSPAT